MQAALDTVLLPRIAARAAAARRPFIVGIGGAQGSGKTTLAQRWRQVLEARGLRTVAMSLDDFYLTRAERAALARSVHPLLRTRGVPGTHAVTLAASVFESLATNGDVAVPCFDKAQDERASQAAWPRVTAPVDVVLFEGWCVGAPAQAEAALAAPLNALERHEDAEGRWRRFVNASLAKEYAALFARLDCRIFLAAPSFDVVFAWRRQQEEALRAVGRGAGVMNDEALARFIQHFERLTRHMLDVMPTRADALIVLDAQRRVAALECRLPA